MTKIHYLLGALFAGLVSVSAAPRHDMYLAGGISKNYVIGSKIITTSGVFLRTPDGDWKPIGYNDATIVALAFDPRDPQVFYTGALNGVWRTLDGGKSWRITNSWDVTEARDVCVDPGAPDNVYAGVSDGVITSHDRAQTWARLENGLPARGKYTQTVEVDRTRAGRVFAGCETGIYLTEDGAQNWRCVHPTKLTVNDIQQSPHDPKFWMAVTQDEGALISHDGGLTWQPAAGVPTAKAIYNVAFDPTNARRIALGSWTYGVLTSEDGGATWIERNAGLPGARAGWREGIDPGAHSVWRVGIDPDDGRLYASVTEDALYVSADFGHTWKKDGLEGSVISRFVFVPRAAK